MDKKTSDLVPLYTQERYIAPLICKKNHQMDRGPPLLCVYTYIYMCEEVVTQACAPFRKKHIVNISATASARSFLREGRPAGRHRSRRITEFTVTCSLRAAR